jgi:hypothetical protein
VTPKRTDVSAPSNQHWLLYGNYNKAIYAYQPPDIVSSQPRRRKVLRRFAPMGTCTTEHGRAISSPIFHRSWVGSTMLVEFWVALVYNWLEMYLFELFELTYALLC